MALPPLAVSIHLHLTSPVGGAPLHRQRPCPVRVVYLWQGSLYLPTIRRVCVLFLELESTFISGRLLVAELLVPLGEGRRLGWVSQLFFTFIAHPLHFGWGGGVQMEMLVGLPQPIRLPFGGS
mmetsp:Transcript_15412/g.15008  ORF Transcript_15412/g.15008 Transcript_15412/m.15008 type:complete len:123 (+) Transcript_15412:728-1096(+)